MKLLHCCCMPPRPLSRCSAFGVGANAQPYPNKTVRLVVADAPGGVTNWAPSRAEAFGQHGPTGHRRQSRRCGRRSGCRHGREIPPDGYTLLLTTTAIYAILPNLRKDLPYDPVKSFVPVSRIATASNVLVVNMAVPAASVAELVTLAKRRSPAY